MSILNLVAKVDQDGSINYYSYKSQTNNPSESTFEKLMEPMFEERQIPPKYYCQAPFDGNPMLAVRQGHKHCKQSLCPTLCIAELLKADAVSCINHSGKYLSEEEQQASAEFIEESRGILAPSTTVVAFLRSVKKHYSCLPRVVENDGGIRNLAFNSGLSNVQIPSDCLAGLETDPETSIIDSQRRCMRDCPVMQTLLKLGANTLVCALASTYAQENHAAKNIINGGYLEI